MPHGAHLVHQRAKLVHPHGIERLLVGHQGFDLRLQHPVHVGVVALHRRQVLRRLLALCAHAVLGQYSADGLHHVDVVRLAQLVERAPGDVAEVVARLLHLGQRLVRRLGRVHLDQLRALVHRRFGGLAGL